MLRFILFIVFFENAYFEVKLWSVNCPSSVGTIDAKVNVCCVYFSPTSRNHLVFGSAGNE
jgi:hypothetical protein